MDLCGRPRRAQHDAFGCLFGVANYAGFTPIAADCGLPVDAAEQTRVAHDQAGAFATSWIGWSEVVAIDWDEPAARPDARIHEYVPDGDGGWRYESKGAWSAPLAKHLGIVGDKSGYGGRDWAEGTEWIIENRLYRVERLYRREAVTPTGEWQPVWSVMRTLASLHGDHNVRLNVWFDRELAGGPICLVGASLIRRSVVTQLGEGRAERPLLAITHAYRDDACGQRQPTCPAFERGRRVVSRLTRAG